MRVSLFENYNLTSFWWTFSMISIVSTHVKNLLDYLHLFKTF